jgi:hypothetical protein
MDLHGQALSANELLSMIKFGADQIFSATGKAITVPSPFLIWRFF